MKETRKNLLLFVEDEGYAHKAFGPTIKSGGYEILGPVRSKEEAIRTIEENQDDIVIGLVGWYVNKCVKFQVTWSRLQGQRCFSN